MESSFGCRYGNTDALRASAFFRLGTLLTLCACGLCPAVSCESQSTSTWFHRGLCNDHCWWDRAAPFSSSSGRQMLWGAGRYISCRYNCVHFDTSSVPAPWP